MLLRVIEMHAEVKCAGVSYLVCFVLTERSCQHGDSIEPFYSSPLKLQPVDDLIHILHHVEGDRFHSLTESDRCEPSH